MSTISSANSFRISFGLAGRVCNVTGGAYGVNHFTYENPVQNVKCNAGTSAPTGDLATKRTVCCRP